MNEPSPCPVAVLGIGRVGLPLALFLADRGHEVVGLDVDPKLVETLSAGRMPFLEEGAEEILERVIGTRFVPTLDPALLATAEVLIVTLGTPVDDHLNPEFSALDQILARVGPHLRAGQLFVLRSTVTPGTTDYVARRLAKVTGLEVGRELFLAFCPERIAQGQSLRELPLIPQIVGTLDPESEARASAFFGTFTPQVLTSDARSAEIAKLFCNVYRYIDFAIGNEFMMLADQHERDIYEIRRLVNEGYPRGGLRSPGFTGGPCLYKDGFFLVERTPFPDLLTTAWKINESVPSYLIERARVRLGGLEDKTCLVLGLAFKREIDDSRNSLAYKAIKVLRRCHTTVLRHDPYLAPGPLAPLLAQSDFVLVATDHNLYRALDPATLRQAAAQRGAPILVADVWNVFRTGRVFFSVPDELPEDPEADE